MEKVGDDHLQFIIFSVNILFYEIWVQNWFIKMFLVQIWPDSRDFGTWSFPCVNPKPYVPAFWSETWPCFASRGSRGIVNLHSTHPFEKRPGRRSFSQKMIAFSFRDSLEAGRLEGQSTGAWHQSWPDSSSPTADLLSFSGVISLLSAGRILHVTRSFSSTVLLIYLMIESWLFYSMISLLLWHESCYPMT